jgi:hypothetical protein
MFDLPTSNIQHNAIKNYFICQITTFTGSFFIKIYIPVHFKTYSGSRSAAAAALGAHAISIA